MGQDFVYEPAHVEVAIERMLSQWRSKPRISALVQALATGVQVAEDEIFEIHVSSQFAAASGDALDKWGEFVGEERGELDDADYRVFIQARILANNTITTTDELIAIWALITAPSLEIAHRTLSPLTYVMTVLRTDFMTDARSTRVSQLMATVRAGGIAHMLVESIPGYFGFDEDPDSLGYDLGIFSREL